MNSGCSGVSQYDDIDGSSPYDNRMNGCTNEVSITIILIRVSMLWNNFGIIYIYIIMENIENKFSDNESEEKLRKYLGRVLLLRKVLMGML
jgi:hypothetical protein